MYKYKNISLGILVFIVFLICSWIFFPRSISYQLRKAIAQVNKYEGKDVNKFKYAISILNIHSGHAYLNVEEEKSEGQNALKTSLSIRPPHWLQIVSQNNVGIDFSSYVDKLTFLPYRFEQSNLHSVKRGKSPKFIAYNHKNLSMERKNYKEDIYDDTRDFLSTITWIMFQDYKKKPLIKSTCNISRDLYLLVGRVDEIIIEGKNKKDIAVQIKCNIVKLDKKMQVVNYIPSTIYLLKKNKNYIPLLFNIKTKLFSVTLSLR